MIPKFVKIAQPILDYYIKDPRNLMDHQKDLKLSVITEEHNNMDSPPLGTHKQSVTSLTRDSVSPPRMTKDVNFLFHCHWMNVID